MRYDLEDLELLDDIDDLFHCTVSSKLHGHSLTFQIRIKHSLCVDISLFQNLNNVKRGSAVYVWDA